jgi:hypothetical protein
MHARHHHTEKPRTRAHAAQPIEAQQHGGMLLAGNPGVNPAQQRIAIAIPAQLSQSGTHLLCTLARKL